ncbi:hypothetical protein GS8_632 [Geobacillus stearothermophilus]|uniref:Uncharacterized protein n=1 Tax=Geobacillus stearothermophilus TaxID=1422 RepID=A0ABQ7HJF0_GEOSE|nr:hypothetical protein GS8_632 [Geobacillus stearothermophilus]
MAKRGEAQPFSTSCQAPEKALSKTAALRRLSLLVTHGQTFSA